MAEISNNELSAFVNKIVNNTHASEPTKESKFLVLSIHRYTNEPSFSKQLNSLTINEEDIFDIVLTDGKHKLKCLLDVNLNELVHRNVVSCGLVISICPSNCFVKYDEASLKPTRFIVIKCFTVDGEVSTEVELDEVTYLESCTNVERSAGPLITCRGCYLPLLHSTDPCGDVWYTTGDEEQEKSVKVNYATIGAIAKLSQSWKRTGRSGYLPLVVKILSRSRIRYYGKSNKTDKWPYQCFFEVGDKSGSCSLVLWNALCPELYTRLSVGQVLYIKNFTVRERYQLMSRAENRNDDLPRFSIEINLNKHHPTSEYKILTVTRVPDVLQLPEVKCVFCSRRQSISLPDGFNCELAGIVTYVGRSQRLRKGKSQPSEFCLYRWIELIDESCEETFRVELFGTSQPELNHGIRPGHLLLCTQMRLVHSLGSLECSYEERTHYFTTCNESQVYSWSLDDVPAIYSREERIQKIQNWAQSTYDRSQCKARSSVGGYYNYPYLPTSLAAYMKRDQEIDRNPIGMEEFDTEVARLHYREFRRLPVQAFITSVQFFAFQTGDARKQGHDTSSLSPEPLYELLVDKNAPVQDSIKVIGSCHEGAQFFKRRMSSKDAPALVGTVHIPFQEYTSDYHASKEEFTELPLFDGSEYLLLSLVGLNKTHKVMAIFPLAGMLDNSLSLRDILSGKQNTNQSRLMPTLRLLKRLLSTRDESLQGVRFLCVLDVYSLGVDREIMLNRAYEL